MAVRRAADLQCSPMETPAPQSGAETPAPRLMRIWQRMLAACQHPTHADYPAHGALGITVCADWAQSCHAFADWAMSANYAADRFLIRVRIREGFCPKNCWWVEASVHRRYVQYIRPVAGEGHVQPLGHWLLDARCRVDFATFTRLLAQGWSVERILTAPPAGRQRGRKYPFAASGIPPGMVFGRLTVTSLPLPIVFPSGWPHYQYLCRCRCGTVDHAVLATNLLTGQIISCGCFQRETRGNTRLTHGDARRAAGQHPLYRIWERLVQICTNPHQRDYARYGQHGIAVCLAWQHEYPAFRAWAEASGYQPGMRIERYDPQGDFTPENCYWTADAPLTTRSRCYTFAGETKTLAAWARDPRCVVSYPLVIRRLRAGWTFEAALTLARQRESRSQPITAFGEAKSLQAWSRDARCLVHWQCLSSRLRAGWAPETALTTPSGRTHPGLTAFGETQSLAAWGRDHRCVVTEPILRQRLAKGWAVEAALTTPRSRRPPGLLYKAFGEWKTLRAWADDPRCVVPLPTVRSRLADGWSLEAALTTRPSRR